MSVIFGPINSRRFGMSLGIDLSPSSKQCNFDCLYCELAPSATVSEQKNVVEMTKVIEELKEHLDTKLDVITLTANGEPTLYPYLNELIDEIDKIKNKTQTLILTNSATLRDKKVFNTLLKIDQVKLSLDAISPNIFKKIDRPHATVNIKEIASDVIRFSKTYKGKLFIEILFVHTLNDTKDEIQKLNDVLLQTKATRIDIGTIDRPPAYNVTGLNYKDLYDISLMFDNSLPIHIASRADAKPSNLNYTKKDILNTLERRPLTQNDIDLLFDDESKKRLQKLINKKKVEKKTLLNIEFLVPHANIRKKHQN